MAGGSSHRSSSASTSNESRHSTSLTSHPSTSGSRCSLPPFWVTAANTFDGRLLPALHRGDLIGCQLFSEPDAGSDLSAVRSSATLHEETWELVGEKVWTSKAQFSDLGLCIARTAVAEDPHAGLTMFLVDMHAPGVEVRPLRQMNGHASFNHVLLDGVRVPDAYRLGDVGEGWAVVRTTLASERAGVGKGAKDPAGHALANTQR